MAIRFGPAGLGGVDAAEDRLEFYSKKDKISFEILSKKINQILENPETGKPLTANMIGQRRVHIGKSYVLTYEILEKEKIIRLLDFDHHDRVYK